MAHHKAHLSTDHIFQLDDKVQIPVRCLKPISSSGVFQVLVYGGGFFLGLIDVHVLAPEHPFPTGLNDSCATLKWAVNSAKLFGASLQQGFILDAESAGASYAATMAHRTRNDPLFKANPITGHILSIPTLIHPDAYPDQWVQRFVFLGGPAVYMTSKYLGGSPTNPEVSPLLFPSLKGYCMSGS
ncbi:Alpha/Beta hydrolase protein [Mycena floridula]|nr:Alpha/Beta hydrolase protein [Mycena floridula]